ncbi:MAG TPA: hypothetical protein PLU17_04870 [Chitinophagaceae bacterium]|nr:hypothetical protein [Chitinophagaceae bacterium]
MSLNNSISFEGRNLVIATKHGKENVIAPIIEKEMGVICLVPDNFDTDELGTFTGEIERELDQIATARKKCHLAMDLTGADLAISSEGSFGPHPSLYFVHSDDELLMLIDKKNNLELFVRFMTVETNFNGREITHTKQLFEFANLVKFPSHGLIIKKAKHDLSAIEKGILDWKKLSLTANLFLEKYGSFYVETDMRAMYNPSRMNFIEKVTEKLITKIKSTCPECMWPGFSISEIIEGLPCDLCTRPTNSPLKYKYICQKCSFSNEVKFPNQVTSENPMYCNFCNP